MGKSAEIVGRGISEAVDEPGDHALVQTANEVGMFPCEVGKRTVAERDHRTNVIPNSIVARIVSHHRVESKPVEVIDERFEGRRAVGVQPGSVGAFAMADGLGVVSAGVQALGHGQHHSCQDRHGRRLQTERRGVSGERIAVLRSADIAPATDFDVDEADVTHPVEVRANRVGVQRQGVGDLGGDQRARRPRQLEVDRVARVVTQGLEEIQLGRNGHAGRLHGRGR